MSACQISVVIPTYQRCAAVHRALQALARQTLAPDEYEVIVSIDGSEDGTREMIAQLSIPYALRVNWQPNRGRAAACNAGVLQARSELLVFLDDDMEPIPEFLAAHQHAHSAGSRLGVLGAVPIAIDESSPPPVEYISSKFKLHLDKLAQTGYSIHFRDFYSGNFSIRHETFLEVGAFNEAFKIYGNEDGELALRLLQAGIKLVYCPEAWANQHYEKDFQALARDNVSKGRTAVLFASTHTDAFQQLKISTYREGSLKWRLLRAGLLWVSRIWKGMPDQVSLFINWLEKRRPARLHIYYALALDYFFWLGARSELRERSAHWLTLSAESAEKS